MSIRQSTRMNKGIPPSRYGHEEERVNPSTQNEYFLEESIRNSNNSSGTIQERNIQSNVVLEPIIDIQNTATSIRSKRTNSSRQSHRSLAFQETEELIELEREKAERDRKREDEEFERRKRLIKLKYRQEKERSEVSSRNSESTSASRVRDWVNSQPLQKNNQQTVENYTSTENGNEMAKLTEIFTKVIKSVKTDNNNDFIARRRENESIARRYNLAKDLPTFNGNLEDWPNFIIQYEQSNELCGFTDQENIIRLEKCLKGKARDVVKSLLISSRNVPEIIQTLELNFGKPEHIIMTMIEQTKRIPAPKEYNLNTFLDFSNGVRNLVTTIETLNCYNYLVNPQLLMEFTNKLPFNLKLSWANVVKAKHGDISLKDFADWSKEMSITISYVNMPDLKKEEAKNWHKNNVQNQFQRKNTILVTNDDESSETNGNFSLATNQHTPNIEERNIKCLFCEELNHRIVDCRKFIEMNLQKRWEFATTNHLCICCLRKGHRASKCRRRKICNVQHCDKYHHQLLHKSMVQNEVESLNQMNVNIEDSSNEIEIINHSSQRLSKVLLRVIPVVLLGPKGQISTYALFDEGSTTTLLDKEIAEQLGLEGPNVPFSYQWLNNVKKKEDESRMVSFKIRGIGTDMNTYTVQNVRTIDNLSLPYQTMIIDELKNKFDYLKNTVVHSYENVRPKVLIGQDNAMLTIARQVIHNGEAGAPLLSETMLGWVVHGKIDGTNENQMHTSLHLHVSQDQVMHDLIKQYFKTEDFGVKIISTNIQSKLEKKGDEIMKSTIKKINNENRYEVGLLWRDENEVLPESYGMAYKRLQILEKKMDKDPSFAAKYTNQFESYIDKNYIRKLDANEIQPNKKEWYLPHFGVTNVKKPGKLRMVMDAAAKTNGLSLNDALLCGPDLLQSLVGILFNFRRHKYAFTGDIKEMFHQVVIRKEDRPAQRLLWRDSRRHNKPDVYEMSAMIFGLKCSPSMAQFVKNFNAEEHSTEFPNAAVAIQKRHYVDDYLDCCETLEEAESIIADVIEVHKRGGFIICNWSSNSSEINQKIPTDLLKVQNKNLQLDNSLSMERVLGLWWNCESDSFEFNVQSLLPNEDAIKAKKNPTKRDILKITMSIFDPLGFVAPYTVQAKILIQDIWRSGLGWDDELSGLLLNKWNKWFGQINELKSVIIPRCYTTIPLSQATNIDMHVFCDASEQAFGAVVYLKIDSNNNCCTSFVASKNRVAPMKILSIPRLELQAAVLGTRLSTTIKKELDIKINQTYYWSDNKTVLCWLRSETIKLNTFVAHRVGEILESSDVEEWNWVPTKENVADDITRDIQKCDLSSQSRWWYGPSFLLLSKDQWPKESTSEIVEDDEIEFIHLIQPFNDLELPSIDRFSKWSRLIRSTAWILRYITNLKAKAKKQLCKIGELDPLEIESATMLWYRQVQNQSFKEEYTSLLNGKPVAKSSRLYQLSPFVDENSVLRLNSRIQNADVQFNQKFPVILDSRHRFTEMLLMHYHNKVGHNGMELVANEVKQDYWIINLKAAVRKCWHKCYYCKNKRAKPSKPEMGQLPRIRMESFVRPFTYTGIDYFGPFEVTIGRRREKRYGVIFTCLTIRAIHLEIANFLNTDSAIMAVRRMIARRGYPKEFFSDNGTNLRSAEKELRQSLLELNQNQIVSELSANKIKWHFIPPAAPHMGGSWERLVRSVKIALDVMIKTKCPREEVLQTAFAEVENIINSRPLTDVSISAHDQCCLTPNNFLIGTTSSAQLPGSFDDSDLNVRKQWRIAQRLVDHFWQRWIKEYIPTLVKRSKWYQTENPIKLNDIVLIMDNNLPRNQWLIGKVIDVHPGQDGIVRVATVQTTKCCYKRPVVKLCKLTTEILS